MRYPLRKGLPKLPATMRQRPIDARGYPVPFFVAWPDGQPDHRIAEPIKLMRCVRDGLCWICGQPLRSPAVAVIGPMCGVNHVSSEPPSHETCARFAVTACPFLSRPLAHRREAGLAETPLSEPTGMLKHNPGVSLLWWTDRVEAFSPVGAGRSQRTGARRVLFDIGTPLRVEWWTEGRRATREEAERAIAIGLPKLEALAQSDEDRAMLRYEADALRAWLPLEEEV